MEKKLKHKFDLLSAYGRTEDDVEESHRIELCSIAMNTLIYLPDKSILPYSFEKFGQSLEEYLNNDSNLTDDVSYLICASFLKEYYLYKTKIDTDTNDIESSDVYKIWHDFKELTIPISENNPIFNDEFYRELKRDDAFLDSIYFCLSIKNNELEKKEHHT
ncbi:hypothetical protein [Actinobacillus equuli]|uniref:hypothetical protein n=1 Tax=Actinobacillus equuli TaxID=718 RepID=UPI00244192EC|nr:hypothetical protein [Actinobacillus equuli]WGE48713.1 hypothetical protein NYR67_10725 [Actinobacillus equuli subsp. equuli]